MTDIDEKEDIVEENTVEENIEEKENFDNRELFDEKGSKIGFHTNDRLNSHEANVNLLIGKRSNGKSYSTLAFDGIKRFIDSGYKDAFAYIRRFDREMNLIKRDIFNGMVQNGWLEWYTKGKWNDIYYWQNRWYLRHINEEGEVDDKCKDALAYAFCINTSDKAKGPDYISIRTMIFDEFIPISHVYAFNEVEMWNNLISTIDRNRNRVKIYMIANTISKECPHFEYYGIDPDLLEKDRIYVGKVGTVGKLAIEYCADEGDPETKESVYFNFDDGIGAMILGGDWQNRRFPSLPENINVDDKAIFSIYMLLREKLIRGTFLSLGDVSTIYFERVDDYKIEPDDLLFIDDQYSDSMLYKNVIVRLDPSNNVAKTVLKYLNQRRCYYDSDDTGEKVAYFATL